MKNVIGGSDIGDNDFDEVFDEYGDHDTKKVKEREKRKIYEGEKCSSVNKYL
jgi:hypothetical protein